VVLQRQTRHGWGKGAVAGAVVGVLFPPSLLGAAAVGAGGGALVARFSRALGRGKTKDLGEALDDGSLAIIVVAPEASGAKHSNTARSKLIEVANTVRRSCSAVNASSAHWRKFAAFPCSIATPLGSPVDPEV